MNVVAMTMVLVVFLAKCAPLTLAYFGLKPGLEAHPASPTLPQLHSLHCSVALQHMAIKNCPYFTFCKQCVAKHALQLSANI